VLGGVGQVGRNFVKYCVDNSLCSFIRVADKQLPVTSYFSPACKEAFESVEFVQSDLTKPGHLDRVFKDTSKAGAPVKFDYVFNLAAETKYGQPEEAYQSKCSDLSFGCATRAKQMGVARFIEVSTAHVYESQARKPATEENKIKPWTVQAQFKLEAEQRIASIDDLPYVILRPATCYGPGDVTGLMPRAVCAASYVQLNEKMKFLWDGNLRLNTIHMIDMCRAMWHVAHVEPKCVGQTFNLADKGDTDQGKVNAILATVFNIKTGFAGKMLSNMARTMLTTFCNEVNEKHLKPWSDLCKQMKIYNTPLSPFLDKELLYQNHLFIDGSKIENFGFQYKIPEVTVDNFMEMVQSYIDTKLFPPIVGAGNPDAEGSSD